MRRFDYIVIGAGPCGIAALHGLPEGKNIACVTGQSPTGLPKAVHPKIRSVAVAEQRTPNLERHPSSREWGAPISREIGGFANYWGQQFERFTQNDPWPEDRIGTYSNYLKICRDIEAWFNLESTADALDYSDNEGRRWRLSRPRQIVSSIGGDLPFSAMREVYHRVRVAKNITSYDDAAIRLELERDSVIVSLASGNRIRSASILLCAGVPGTLKLISQSVEGAQSYSFDDHCPILFYCADFGDGLRSNSYSPSPSNFNALRLTAELDEKTEVFASLYKMSLADMSVVFPFPPRLARMKFPRIVDLFKPIQVWTPNTVGTFSVERGRHVQPPRAKAVHARALWDHVKGSGFFDRLIPISWDTTSAGDGYHFHNAAAGRDAEHLKPIDAVLREAFSNHVHCLDAGSMQHLSARPHTLSAMVRSVAVARTL